MSSRSVHNQIFVQDDQHVIICSMVYIFSHVKVWELRNHLGVNKRAHPSY